jgi:hypothetical protein
MTTVTVHWYYTNEMAHVTDNVRGELELVTKNANSAYAESNIPLTVKIRDGIQQ